MKSAMPLRVRDAVADDAPALAVLHVRTFQAAQVERIRDSTP